jgi:hypothetical protein
VDDPTDEWITSRLIAELRTEQFDEPDNEHTQVSVGNEHWSVTAQVSGLITFDNMDLLEGEPSDLPETMHLRDIPDSQLIAIWQAVVRGDLAALLDNPDAECLAPARLPACRRRCPACHRNFRAFPGSDRNCRDLAACRRTSRDLGKRNDDDFNTHRHCGAPKARSGMTFS